MEAPSAGTVLLTPASLRGTTQAPPSKSAAHRVILCAALSALSGGGTCFVHPLAESEDIAVTLNAARTLGASIREEKDGVRIGPGQSPPAGCPLGIDCGESGSSLRFLIPIAAALGIPARFTGRGRLPQRPIGLYTELLPPRGVRCETKGGLPFSISGRLTPGLYELPGDISSQFITGLLLALPLLEAESEIRLTTPLQSAAYVEMTLEVLSSFGVRILPTETGWKIPGKQVYASGEHLVEGDWSQAAFFLTAGAVGGDVCVSGLKANSLQGDKAVFDLLTQFGAKTYTLPGQGGNALFGCRAPAAGKLRGIEIDASQIPDLVPILAVAGASAEGETLIYNAERLRIKESDRLAAVAEGLSRMGASVTELPGGLRIRGGRPLSGGRLRGWNDHRIVMAFSTAALSACGKTEITDPQSIRKSFPDFFTRYNELGGNAHVCSSVRLGK